MSRFPINYIHNTGNLYFPSHEIFYVFHSPDMDKKRLSYLIYTIEDDMKLAQFHNDTVHGSSFKPAAHSPSERHTVRRTYQTPNLRSLFENREREIEQCNMLLLLMLAGLEYSIPTKVMQATLETAKLTCIGYIHTYNVMSKVCLAELST